MSLLINYLIFIIALASVISIILFILIKDKEILSKLVFTGALLSLIFGYIYQKKLGIMRGFSFVNDSLLDITLQSVSIDLLIILSIFWIIWVIYRKYKKYFILFISIPILYGLVTTGAKVIDYINLQENKANAYTFETDTNDFDDLKSQFNFSKNGQNIVVLVSDAFPADMFDDFLKNHPEYNEDFAGFTWYRNTVSIGTYTLASTAGLVKGEDYSIAEIGKRKNGTLGDIIDKAWIDHSEYFNNLGYRTVYRSPKFLSAPSKLIENGGQLLNSEDLSNYWKANIPDYAIKDARTAFFSTWTPQLEKKILSQLTLFKLSPYLLKNFIYSKLQNELKKTNPETLLLRYQDTEAIYSALERLPNTGEKKPLFQFFWTNSTIRPYHINSEGTGPPIDEFLDGKYNPDENMGADNQIKYTLNKLLGMVKRLKELGVYENTTIVFISDHGSTNYGSEWHDHSIYPMLMINDSPESNNLQISNKSMSNADLFTITSLAAKNGGLPPLDESTDISPYYSGGSSRERYFWATNHGNYDSLKKQTLPITYGIKVTGDIYNKENWEKISYDDYINISDKNEE